MHLRSSRSYITCKLSLDENYHLCQPTSWNSTIVFPLIILTIIKCRRNLLGSSETKYITRSSYAEGKTEEPAEGEEICYVSMCVYTYIHIKTVIIFKIKLFGKEQALTNIVRRTFTNKVRRNVIPRGQMRLFNLSVCWKHLSGMKLSTIIYCWILSSLDKRRISNPLP